VIHAEIKHVSQLLAILEQLLLCEDDLSLGLLFSLLKVNFVLHQVGHPLTNLIKVFFKIGLIHFGVLLREDHVLHLLNHRVQASKLVPTLVK